jgi:hypothetical protein
LRERSAACRIAGDLYPQKRSSFRSSSLVLQEPTARVAPLRVSIGISCLRPHLGGSRDGWVADLDTEECILTLSAVGLSGMDSYPSRALNGMSPLARSLGSVGHAWALHVRGDHDS